MKAEWGIDYDWRNDECFQRPMHPECDAPILKDDRGIYYCIGCGKAVDVDENMKEWIEKRSGEKTETGKCFKCGKNTAEEHYYRNANTLEWELGWSECKECGTKIIV